MLGKFLNLHVTVIVFSVHANKEHMLQKCYHKSYNTFKRICTLSTFKWQTGTHTELCVPPQMFNMHMYFILYSLKSFPALLLSHIHLKENQNEDGKEVRKEWERAVWTQRKFYGRNSARMWVQRVKKRKKLQVTVSVPLTVKSEVVNLEKRTRMIEKININSYSYH